MSPIRPPSPVPIVPGAPMAALAQAAGIETEPEPTQRCARQMAASIVPVPTCFAITIAGLPEPPAALAEAELARAALAAAALAPAALPNSAAGLTGAPSVAEPLLVATTREPATSEAEAAALMFVFTFELRSAVPPAGKSGVEKVDLEPASPPPLPIAEALPVALVPDTEAREAAAAPAATAFEEAAILAFRSGVMERSRRPRVREPERDRERAEREREEEGERECELSDSERLFEGDPLPPRSPPSTRSSRSRALLMRRVSAAGGGVSREGPPSAPAAARSPTASAASPAAIPPSGARSRLIVRIRDGARGGARSRSPWPGRS